MFNLILGAMLQWAEPVPPADVIFFNGEIVTYDDRAPLAESVVVKDGKIVFAGDVDAAYAFQGEQTEMIDLKGKALLPKVKDQEIEAGQKGDFVLYEKNPTKFPEAQVLETWVDGKRLSQ